jgi:hypothetical protein
MLAPDSTAPKLSSPKDVFQAHAIPRIAHLISPKPCLRSPSAYMRPVASGGFIPRLPRKNLQMSSVREIQKLRERFGELAIAQPGKST